MGKKITAALAGPYKHIFYAVFFSVTIICTAGKISAKNSSTSFADKALSFHGFTGVVNDVGATFMLTPADSGCTDSVLQIVIIISNFGTVDETSIPVIVNVTGTVTQTINDTYSGLIPVGGSDR